MSVLHCGRNGCNNIMCNRLSYEMGYICNECFLELVNSGVTTDPEEFMNSPKVNAKIPTEDSYKKFNKLFPFS